MISQEQIDRYGELPLVLESEVGRSMMPMRDILALAPGSILKLPSVRDGRVQLFAGGAPFATGEVVRAGGGNAIRILEFGKRKDS